MAAPVMEVPSPELRSARQAMLVIHGIGEQNPYETLDSFARGIFTNPCRLERAPIVYFQWLTSVSNRLSVD